MWLFSPSLAPIITDATFGSSSIYLLEIFAIDVFFFSAIKSNCSNSFWNLSHPPVISINLLYFIWDQLRSLSILGSFLPSHLFDKNPPARVPKANNFILNSLHNSDISKLALLSNKKNTSIANISSRYILEDPNVASVIIGARLGENNHIEDHKKISNITLSTEEKNLISKSLNLLTRVPGDCGDEYRKPPFLTASGDLSHHLDSIPNVYEVKNVNHMRKNISSNTSWEKMASYSRAVKFGNRIIVSGTTATHENKVIGIEDPIAQTDFIIDKIEASISSLGGRLEDVVRTRVFVKNIRDWQKVAETHGKRFRDINPANTLVQANLVGDDYLVEIEAEAIINE